jgi:NAD(P)H-hydrate epimerase
VRPAAFEPLLTADEMRAEEARHAGRTLELMERAGAACAKVGLGRFPGARRWSVRCGTGANGGDGLVAARHLHAAGREVEVWIAGDEGRVSGDAAESLGRARDSGVRLVPDPGPADVVVDALFGTGLAGPLRPEGAAAVEAVLAAGVPVLAVDVPSGVDASTGEAPGPAVAATVTVTFHARKVGHAVAPGRFLAGEVVVADIGLGACAGSRDAAVLDGVLTAIPARTARDHKYSAGSVLVVGGSTGLTGAPCLAAEAALRAGAGIVTACVPASLGLVFEQRLLEVMTRSCADENGALVEAAAPEVLAAAQRARAVAIGPGLGRSAGAARLARRLLAELDRPVVVDADGLAALEEPFAEIRARQGPTVLTPHAGELARLLGATSAEVQARRRASVVEAAERTGAVVLLKGADTLVAGPGTGVLVCEHGTPALATAGTGDVLAGVVAAFLAKGVEARIAAAAAATAHGLAGRLAGARVGEAGVIASDVIESLARAVSRAPAEREEER